MRKIETSGPQSRNDDDGGDGWCESWRTGEEDPDERTNSWKSRETGKSWSRGLSADEEDGFIKCFDDITGKELRWKAVKEGREKELEYLRELGVSE